MKKGWRKISCLAIATLAMVFTFATCTINIDSPETNTEQGGETAHEWDNGKITKAATENDDGEKTFTCTKCGETKTEIIPALGHKHTIASEWASDEVLHWHEASCEKEEHRADKAAHEWNAGEIIKAATESDDGEKRFVCAICGKIKAEAIPALNHEHKIASEWASDEVLHWHEASCGKEEHRTDKAAHEWNEGKITKAATENDDGEKTFACTTCGETRTEAIPALNHEHTIASEWTSDEALHWHEASCGKEEHRTDKTAHIWNTGEVTTEPTCIVEGERVYTCTVCGVTKTEPIAAKGHSFSITWKCNASNHWNECTGCEERGNFAEHATMFVTLTSDGERKEACPTCGYGDVSSAWTKDTLSELSAALDDYVETNANAKVKIVGELSDSDITTISDVLKQFSKNYGSSKQIDMDLSGTIGLEIMEQMFYKCKSLVSITLPNDLTTIGVCAFEGCTSLASVTLPNGLTTIGTYAFYYCTSLASVTLPNNLTTIGKGAFQFCTSLASIILPNGLTTISTYMFAQCESLVSITLPNNLTTIEDYAFEDCTSLANITLPNSLTTIGNSAFYNCASLARITLPYSLTTIGTYAFNNCKSLASVTLPNGLTTIGDHAFYKCTSLASVTLSDGLTTIGTYMFNRCTSLTSVTIPKSITRLGYGAFYECSKLEKVEGMEGLTIIESWTFYRCPLLKTIRIPSSVTEIGYEAFADAELEEITLCEGLEKIDYRAFYNCKSLKKIEIPSTVNFIDGWAFRNCTSLTSIKFKDTSNWKYKKQNDDDGWWSNIDVSGDKSMAYTLTKSITDKDIVFDFFK